MIAGFIIHTRNNLTVSNFYLNLVEVGVVTSTWHPQSNYISERAGKGIWLRNLEIPETELS